MNSPFPLDSIAINYLPGNTNKRPFVFLHGNSQNDTCGTGVIDYFQKLGHSVLSYDLPGHGDSKLSREDYTFKDLIDLNQCILQHFSIRRPILCGHSLGGMIHAGCITKFELIDSSLILCGSYDGNPVSATKQQKQESEAQAIDQALNAYISEAFRLFKRAFKYDYYSNRHIDDEILAVINRRYTQPIANANNLQTGNDFDVRKKLSQINIPILILHGEKETIIPKSLIDTMLPEYKNIKVAWYQDKGHYAFYQQPEITNQYLDQFYNYLINP